MKNNYTNYSFLFSQADYKERISSTIKNAREIGDSQDFKDIIKNIQLREFIQDYKLRFINSKKVKFIFLPNSNPPKGINVIATGTGNNTVIYVDCSNIIFENRTTGKLECRNNKVLLHYIDVALISYTVNSVPNSLLRKAEFIKNCTEIYGNMFTYVYEYLHKLSSSENLYEQFKYLTCVYFQYNILGMSFEESDRNAVKLANLSNKGHQLISLRIGREVYDKPINEFFEIASKAVNDVKDIPFASFLQKWLTLYGEATPFMLELFVPFIDNIIAINDGSYINNRNTIEKVGNKNLIQKVSLQLSTIMFELYSNN